MAARVAPGPATVHGAALSVPAHVLVRSRADAFRVLRVAAGSQGVRDSPRLLSKVTVLDFAPVASHLGQHLTDCLIFANLPGVQS